MRFRKLYPVILQMNRAELFFMAEHYTFVYYGKASRMTRMRKYLLDHVETHGNREFRSN